MRPVSDCAEHLAAVVAGTIAVCLGSGGGAVEASIGVAGLAGVVIGRQEKFGLERARIRRDIEFAVKQKYKASEGSSEAKDIEAAASTLQTSLEACFIDGETLAKCAVTEDGFLKAAIAVVMQSLGNAHPELFGDKVRHAITYCFAHDMVEAGITSAIGNRRYYENLEPHLILEMASALGSVESKVDNLDRKFDAFAKQMNPAGDGKALKSKITKLEKKLNAKVEDLLALVAYIIGKGVTEQQLDSSLQEAYASLQKSRAEMENLRNLANEVPEIEGELATARNALASGVYIDIEAAQAALKAARVRYQQEITRRHRNESLNVARMMEAEASLALTRFEFLEAAKLYGQAAKQLPIVEKIRRAKFYEGQGFALYNHSYRFGNIYSLNKSVTAFEHALRACAEAEMPTQWASIQCNLGIAYLILGQRGGGADAASWLQKSGTAFEQALRVYTKANMLTKCIEIQSNLGGVCRERGKRGNGAEAYAWLQKSASIFEQALGLCTEAAMLTLCAGIQNNLGIVYKDLSQRVGDAKAVGWLQKSVTAYEAALLVYTEAEMPVDWSMTQNNLCIVYRLLGERIGNADAALLLQQSLTAGEQALRVRTEADMPVLWAETQNNLGNVYKVLGVRSGDADAAAWLQKSVTAYEQTLGVKTEVNMPADWAMTQMNLGNVCQMLSKRDGVHATAWLEKSVTAYLAALRVYTEADMPDKWAEAQNCLGIVCWTMSKRDGDTDSATWLQKSVTAYEQALRFYGEAKILTKWAETLNNLGKVFQALADLGSGADSAAYLQKAVVAYEGALRVFDQPGFEYHASTVSSNLSHAQIALAKYR
jgi:tetratricopeptide (TPR) repeat protein